MKIRVQRRNGDIETIEIGSVKAIHEPSEPENPHSQGYFECGSIDHYFTADGYYDGWGKCLIGSELTESEAVLLIDQVEANRKVEPV